MTASVRSFTALLGRGGLTAGTLLVIAGILGMHAMTSNHSAHPSHSVSHDVGVPKAWAAATGHGGTGYHADHSAKASLVTETCAGYCPGMQHAGAACIPLANTGSLTVFPPPEGSFAVENALPSTIQDAVAYSFIPASPTPCDLSISRT